MNNTNYKKWKFFKYPEEQKRRDSSSEKHFTGLRINESLIRESIQNSLDAVKDDSEPVKINMSFIELNKGDCIQYIQGLEQHYQASYQKSLRVGEKIRFLILEDFNTTGLEGENATDFFKNDNRRSGIDNSSSGSHGIGKVVFYLASQFRFFFAFSVYQNECVFEGSCDFKTHTLEDAEYFEDGTLKLCHEEDKNFIEALFTRTQEHGLSIAIPFPDDDLKIEKLEDTVAKEYYYPVINGKLIVKLGGKNIDEGYILAHQEDKQQLIADYMTTTEDQYLSVDVGEKYIGKNEFLDSQQVQQIISRIESNDGGVVIRFNLAVKLKTTRTDKNGYLELLISRKTEPEDEEFHFWRENLLIKNALARKKSSKHYTVIVIIQGKDNALSHVLRALENPSHTKWEDKNPSDKIKNEYQYIGDLVRFVKQLPNKVINSITSSDIKLDSNFFSDYFPDTSARGRISNEGQTSGDTGDPKPSNGVSNINLVYRENRNKNGFILFLSDIGKQNDISKLSITIAYETNKGNPFGNYDIRDFDLQENINIELKGGRQIEKTANRLLCQIKDKDDFKITLSGFDPNRELKIDAKEAVE